MNWNNLFGTLLIIASFVAAFFIQEELMIASGLAGIYCAIRSINIQIVKKGVED